ncbi:MAG: TPM domain-containing protein [Bacteroidota bacterium]
MKHFLISLICILTALAMGACATTAEPTESPKRLTLPTQERYVIDMAGILNSAQQDSLRMILKAYEEESSLHFALVSVADLGGQDLQNLSLEVAKQLKTGQPGLNNGGIILISMAERLLKVEVNYGLEWQISTNQAADILDSMRDQLGKEDYFGAFKTGFQGMYEKGKTVSWDIAFPTYTAMKEAGEEAVGKIARIKARGKTRDYSRVPMDYQFHENLYIDLVIGDDTPARLFFSNYMVEMVNVVVYQDERAILHARVRKTEPLELEMLGLE